MGAVRQAFARNLAYHRERRGWTQAKLAELVETSPSYIGHLERGDREPSLLKIEELSRALGIVPGEFFVTTAAADRADTSAAAAAELQELLRGRGEQDLRLVTRLARAALEDPRINPTSPSAKPARRRRRAASRLK
jgi:transcriptional regulator with XRE-family HTH domain